MLVQALYTMVLFELLPDLCYCFHNQESTVVWSWITCINPIYSLLKWASIIAMTYIASVYSLNPQNLSGFSPILLFFFFFVFFLFLFFVLHREFDYQGVHIHREWDWYHLVSAHGVIILLAFNAGLGPGPQSRLFSHGPGTRWHNTLGVLLWISAPFEHWSAI